MRTLGCTCTCIRDHDPELLQAHNVKPQLCAVEKNPPYDEAPLNRAIVEVTANAVASGTGGEFEFKITNQDRSVGATLSGEISLAHGREGHRDARSGARERYCPSK